MEIDGKMPPLFFGFWFRPVTTPHTAQSGICVRRNGTGRDLGRTQHKLCAPYRSLALRELEPLARALLTVLFALMSAGVARQQSQLL